MPFPKQRDRQLLGKADSAQGPSIDDRFAPLQTDPRYRLPSKKSRHTKLDKRFKPILQDDDFSRKASVDRYGRKLEKSSGRKELERLYRLEEDESASSGDEEHDVQKELRRMDQKYDPARDGGFSDSSSSEEDTDEEEDELEEAELYATEEQVDSIPSGEVSRRIAVVNMDWDNVKADDIYAVALSFLPADGRIDSVVVYPSEFGRERMDREEMEGPPKEIFASRKPKTEELDDEDEGTSDSEEEEERIKKKLIKEDTGEEYNSNALRRYQLDRLRYFYAIITCSSTGAAQAIYDAMDGREYLSSANFFDLRFVPDDITFDEQPRDSCSDVPRDYKPNEFVTDALRHSKVKLTWDADDRQRQEVQKRAFSRREIDDNDLQAYIGSASSSDEDEEEDDDEVLTAGHADFDTLSLASKSTVNRQAKRDALRTALGLGAEPAKPHRKSGKAREEAVVGDMQISFTPGLSAAEERGAQSVFENDPREIEETTMQRYVRRERERKARRKERSKARREGRDPDASASEAEAGGAEQGESGVGNGRGTEDLGFEDPFFTDPKFEEKERKRVKREARAKRAVEEAALAEEGKKQKAELELLMAGEEAGRVAHFDMRAIQKMEKAKLKGERLKNKKKKLKSGEKGGREEEAAGNDGFEIRTNDPRFSGLFQSHEFAIDPTHPRFRKTENMKRLVEEGRGKRLRHVEEQERGREGEGGKMEGNGKAKRVRSEGELGSLVEKIKKRAKT